VADSALTPNGGPPSTAPPPSVADAGDQQREAFVTPPLRARHVYLKPVTPSDYPFLQLLETGSDLAPRWRHRGATPSPEEWVQGLWSGVLTQFIVVGVTSAKPIGRVVIYHPNFQDRYAYFAAMRFEPGDRSPLMILGITLFLRYVFSYWQLEKLYMEVPEYNLPQFSSGLGRFFEIEGRLRGHLRTGGRSWDQLIVAMYRETAAAQGGRLRLDRGQRSAIGDEPAPMGAVVGDAPVLPEQKWKSISWETFAAEVAEIAQVPAAEVMADTRVLEDLGLDSLALAELGVVLVDKYDLWSLSSDLEVRRWENLSVRALYDEYLTGVPQTPTTPATGSGR
jgi:acyl carrier protein